MGCNSRGCGLAVPVCSVWCGLCPTDPKISLWALSSLCKVKAGWVTSRRLQQWITHKDGLQGHNSLAYIPYILCWLNKSCSVEPDNPPACLHSTQGLQPQTLTYKKTVLAPMTLDHFIVTMVIITTKTITEHQHSYNGHRWIKYVLVR